MKYLLIILLLFCFKANAQVDSIRQVKADSIQYLKNLKQTKFDSLLQIKTARQNFRDSIAQFPKDSLGAGMLIVHIKFDKGSANVECKHCYISVINNAVEIHYEK